MNYRIGDYVRFINERQEGIVTSIIDQQLVGVTIEGDFEITVLASEIVLVNDREKQISGNTSAESVTSSSDKDIPVSDRGIYCGLIPDEKISTLYHLYIINNTGYDLLLNCFTEKSKIFHGAFSGKIHQRSFEKISSGNMNEIEKWPKYHFQFLYTKSGEFNVVQPLIISKEFKGRNIFKSESLAPLIRKKGYVLQLDELNIDTQKIMENIHASIEPAAALGLPPKEVDLHIEELTENFPKMNPSEILNYQLEIFRKNLEAAIVHHYPSIIFIHGVGNGTLRTDIHRQLGKHPHVKTFKDARKDKFGYGATEVILK